MIKAFETFLSQKLGLQKGDKILLAVSGGIDSMVMLELFAQSSWQVDVAHCNFQLRGEESNQDEHLVKQTALVQGLNFHLARFDSEEEARENKKGIQETARELRYEWFDKLIEEYKFDYVATAHHLDDQVETVLLNMARGTGIHGLGGMKIRRGKIIRPLMFAWRKEIEAFAIERKVEYRHDQSNDSTKYARNHMRHELIPKLEEINASSKKHLIGLSKKARSMDRFIDEYLNSKKDHFVKLSEGDTEIKLDVLMKEELADEILFRLLHSLGFRPSECQEISKLVESESGKVFKNEKWQVLKNRGQLIISVMEDISPLHCVIEGVDSSDSSLLEISRVSPREVDFSASANIAWMDAQKVEFPLTLRKWKDGDRMQPLGMKGQQKLSDILIQKKINRIDKEQVCVLESNGRVIWVPEIKNSEEVKLDENSRDVLKIEWKKKSKS